ncbi:MAG: hypothetical protein WA892_10760 [Ornithinimicrobium sp.]
MTTVIAVGIVALGAAALAGCLWMPFVGSGSLFGPGAGAAVSTALVGHVVFVVTSSVVIAVLVFLLAYSITDRMARPPSSGRGVREP